MKSCLLSASKVKSLKTRGYHADGGNLYLQVSQYGTKSWVFRFTTGGVTRDMGLGSVDTFSLSEAREEARKCRQLVAQGVNPIEHRRKLKDAAAAENFGQMTFKDAARRFLAAFRGEWRSEKHATQWETSLKAYAYRQLGDRPVSAIEGVQITEALAPIWTSKRVTAQRVKQRVERVVSWVKDGMPLPNTPGRFVKHLEALPYEQAPAFMVELRDRDGLAARALEFTILTATRTSEALCATWHEIDLEAALWAIPGHRRKTGEPLTVPLPTAAVALLRALPRVEDHVFPGAKDGKPLSDESMRVLLRDMMGKGGATVHGFRSTFRDWAGDRTAFPKDVIEAALGHRLKSRVEAAYRRRDAIEKRSKLMETWASYCAVPLAGNVERIHGAA